MAKSLGTKKNNWTYKQIETIATCYDFSLSDPISDIPKQALEVLLKGSREKFEIPSKTLGITRSYKIDFEGFENYIQNAYEEAATTSIKRWADGFMDSYQCSSCNGSRLRKEALHFKIRETTLADLVAMDLKDLYDWTQQLPEYLNENEKKIAIAYTVWSKKKGGGKLIVKEVFKKIKKSNHLNRLVTLSPLTEMATKFHTRNGAKLLQKNETTQNFEYKII